MQFEWDEAKAASNLAKHRLTFTAATAVFEDTQRIDIADARYAYGEDRHVTIGLIRGRICAVVYTVRGEVTRIISARKANQREVREYGNR